MGKGGGGGGAPQPTTTTAYQTNLPEYAQPYVMNMLGAAQNQLFTTKGNQITGFRGYQPYSSDPTDYFAGPSGLQQSAYNAAGMMQSPTQYQTGTGIAGMAGLGQLGAGMRYNQQVTDPNAVQQFMSPYQQGVTDVAKNAAIREYQIANQQGNLGAARQGTYGGARQALQQSERERNLLSNLSNIQAQGSQSAYDRAMQNMQFGSNLGLQGLQGAAATAGTLGQLGGQQQAADINAINLQNQLGGQQQAYQQNIINQAIQDYATQQQYPLMQLSTMNSLLRGLPMQAMTTQGYQAQPSALQQGIGLLGTGASLAGAFKREGGTIKEYAAGGGIRASLENKIDDIADAGGVKGLQGLLAQTKSPRAKELIMERMREEGIAAAPTGKLGTNMAGGGIIAFEEGGDVPGFYEGELIDGFGTSPEAMAMDQMRVDDMLLDKKRKHYESVKAMSPVAAERMLAADPSLERKPVVAPAAAPAANNNTPPPPPSAPPTAPPTGGDQKTGVAKFLDERTSGLAALGVAPGMGEEARGLMDYIKEGKARRQSEAGQDRYLRMAEAFAQFGSTAGPFMTSASKALGGFAKGEAGAQKELRAADLADKKMAADLEKIQRAEARGDYDAAQKASDSYENRKVQREGHLASAQASMYGADRETRMIERAMKDPEFLKTLQVVKGNDTGAVQAIKTQLADINQQIMFAGKDEALKKKLMDQRAALNARLTEIAKVNDTASASAQEIKVVSNEAEYAKLKKGQQYRDPNGEIRTKG